jgi:hypothetical protein
MTPVERDRPQPGYALADVAVAPRPVVAVAVEGRRLVWAEHERYARADRPR